MTVHTIPKMIEIKRVMTEQRALQICKNTLENSGLTTDRFSTECKNISEVIINIFENKMFPRTRLILGIKDMSTQSPYIVIEATRSVDNKYAEKLALAFDNAYRNAKITVPITVKLIA